MVAERKVVPSTSANDRRSLGLIPSLNDFMTFRSGASMLLRSGDGNLSCEESGNRELNSTAVSDSAIN